MTLGDLIDNIDVQGRVHLSVWENGEEKSRDTIGFTDGLRRGQQYFSASKWVYVSDYEDMEVKYIYTNDNGLTIELEESE